MKTSGLSTPKSYFVLFLIFMFSFSFISFGRSGKDQLNAMKGYIDKSGKEPQQYVISKFEKCDIVILNQFNNLKHEVEFVNSLIPAIFDEGVNTLAMEFGNREDQNKVDALIFAKNFDEETAKRILFDFKEYGIWGYQEYLELLRTSWSVNKGIKENDKKFRIVMLNSPSIRSSEKNSEFAKMIERELLSKGKKALVYVSACHSHNCKNSSTAEIYPLKARFSSNLSDKVFSIALHSPWMATEKSDGNFKALVRPADGLIDEVLAKTGYKPVGFDINNSPFCNIKDSRSVYYDRKNDYNLNMVFNGYIFLKEYSDYEPLTWIENFITFDNLYEVKKYYRGINSELKIETVEYATDLCSSLNASLLSKAKMLRDEAYVKLDDRNN